MALITVKFKPTGEVGTIPQEEFDPNIYEQVTTEEQAVSGASQELGDAESGAVAGALGKAAEFIAPKTLDFASGIGTQLSNTLGQVGDIFKGITAGDTEKGRAAGASFLERQKQIEEARKKTTPTTAAKTAAEIGSFYVPFGRGANIASKVLLPGAATGGLRSASEEDADITDIAEGALAGTVTAGAFKALGGMASWATGKGGNLIRGSKALQEGTRKIRQKASVYGDEAERAINATLDKYGFKGTSQDQYAKLQPTIQKIESKIDDFIQKNPSIKVNINDVKESFLKKLQSSVRSGDLTKKQAQNEVKGYLNDLLKAAGLTGQTKLPGQAGFNIGDISLGALRKLKKLVNQDVGNIFEKTAKGTPLTSREKVIKEAWSSLDDVVPDKMKGLLVDESNLYKSAQSLSSARFNPPVQRIMGTSVPQGVTQAGRDALAGTTKIAGEALEAIPQIPSDQIAGVATKLISGLGSDTEIPTEVPTPEEEAIGLEQLQAEPVTPSQSAQVSEDGLWQWDNGQWVPTPEHIRQLKLQDFQKTGGKNIANIEKLEETLRPQADKLQLSDGAIKNISDLNSALSNLSNIETSIGESDLVGPIKGLARFNPYATGSRTLQSDIDVVRQTVGKALEGGVLRKEDEEKYKKILPVMGDTKQIAINKITMLKAMIERDLQNYVNLQSEFGKGRSAENIIGGGLEQQIAQQALSGL